VSEHSFDLILIDFDGTLCATRPAIVHCMRATLAELTGETPLEHELDAVIGRGIGLDDTFRHLAPRALHRNADLLPRLVHSYRERYAQEGDSLTSLFAGWTETLSALDSAGIVAAVVSNKGPKAVHAALARFGIDRQIALVVGDMPGVAKKPDPAVFHQIIRPAYPDVPASRILVVGDTDADIRLARNAGLVSCWAQYGYGDPVLCRSLAPDFVIETPIALGRWLDSGRVRVG
jgi:phosphoglycolate phosphatase